MTLLEKYCKNQKQDIAQFANYESLAETCLEKQKDGSVSKKTIARFRAVLGWHISEPFRRLALEAVVADEKTITKSSALKQFGSRTVNLCPWCLLADNPYYKSSAPMQLYFPSLLRAVAETQAQPE